MRRILYIVPYVPNPIRTRPFNLIRALSALGHDVTVLTLFDNQADEIDAAALRDHAARVIALPLSRSRALANSLSALMTDAPLQAAYCWQPALADQMRQLMREEAFDIVHVEHLRGSRYGLLAKSEIAAAGLTTPVVWDSVDSISHLFRQTAVRNASRFGRLVARAELPRTERYEGRMIAEFDAVLATSPVDRDALAQLASNHFLDNPPIHVLPNGVDLDYFRPDPSIEREPATLALSGKMSYHANVTMAVYLVREVMPLVWASRPETRVSIIGKNPSLDVQALAGDSRVTVTGAVPEIRPYLNRATMAVAPIVYSAGVQNKVLEAMACATPVVTTPIALGGLAAVPGRHLLIGEDSNDLAEAIVDLLENSSKRAALAQAGRDYVETNHDWLAIGARLSSLYESLIAGRVAMMGVLSAGFAGSMNS